MILQAARLVRFCDAFNMPVITLLLAGGSAAQCSPDAAAGSTGSGRGAQANLLFAYASATVPKLVVVLPGADCTAVARVRRHLAGLSVRATGSAAIICAKVGHQCK
jgi:acetyl-CoA carboxylase carboxyltransferase component